MVLSMTGFGTATVAVQDLTLRIQVRSVNSKSFDFYAKLPDFLRELEFDCRQYLGSTLERGKVDLSIVAENGGSENELLNGEKIAAYYQAIKNLQHTYKLEDKETLGLVLQLPIFQNNRGEAILLSKESKAAILQAVKEACLQLITFRTQEGNALALYLMERIKTIQLLFDQIIPLEQERIDAISNKLNTSLKSLAIEVDATRFHQELIYYIEKIDINEEKSRLINHLTYFNETILNEEKSGKKLGFITQEIGREINTIGSKANHAGIQQIVVQMKDELEKIKEQLLNIL